MRAGSPDLVLTSAPRLVESGEHAQEMVAGKVGAAEEGLALGGEEDRHRPAAVSRRRRDRRHVDRVDVGTLLTVDLDGDETLVECGGDRLVLERLMRHHVAPVAGGVAHRQQHRHVALPRLSKGLVAPLLPVHRVVTVLEQVGAGGLGQTVGHDHHAR